MLIQKTLNHMHNFYRAIFLLLIFSNAFGHNSKNDHPSFYTFKERIHGMCAGHHHLDDIELKNICNHFPEHFSEILELQTNAPDLRTENYITKLTSLVIFSDTLTNDQKHDFCRRSCNMALEARKNGNEWKWLLGILVERTDALSLPELQDLMRTTKHEPLKPLIEKAIERKQRKSNTRDRPASQESRMQSSVHEPEEHQQSSSVEHYNRLKWFLAGLTLLGIMVYYLKSFKAKS
jgi:hypothetical protein